MSFRISTKKLAIASALVTPLVLAACGNSDSDAEGANASSSSSTSSSTPSSTASSMSSEASTSESPTEDPVEESSVADAESAHAPAGITPEVTFANLDPINTGQPASPEQAAAIDGLVRGQLNETTLRPFMAYIPNNTCSRVLEEQGAGQMNFNDIPDLPLSAIGADSGTIDSITDIEVDGDTASALVTASASGTTDTGVQRFLLEDGRWKFCN